MDLRASAEDEAFRDEVRTFLEESLTNDFAAVRGRGGPGDDDCLVEERMAWERHLGAQGWTGVAWPKEHGGRGLSLPQQVVYFEEYARARESFKRALQEVVAFHNPGAVGASDRECRRLLATIP